MSATVEPLATAHACDRVPLQRLVASIDHARVMARIVDESGWSGRYAFMTMMAAGIAMLGLLLSSPAVIIGAMLIPPLMSPMVALHREHRRTAATAVPLPGSTPDTSRALEARAAAAAAGGKVVIVPTLQALPAIRFAVDGDRLDRAALLSARQARRWNIPALVPGPPDGTPPDRPNLTRRRALAIAAPLREQGVRPLAAPPAGQSFEPMAVGR